MVVFVIVEGILVYTIFKYRRRPDSPEPEHVHGNTALEITWTLAPALVLVLIAVPTVRSIFRTQAPAPAGALQVQVTGHQWWWEFNYPELGITTANELYLPTGRAVNFTLRTADVIHSFWIPNLGGKRDLVSNRTNHIWYTPDSVGVMAFNGSCNEYCGTSHANMRLRAFTVAPEDFDRWVAQQRAVAAFGAVAAAQPAAATPALSPGGAPVPGQQPAAPAPPPASATPPPAADSAATAMPAAASYEFPRDRLGPHVIPKTPIPSGLQFNDNLLAAGDASRGMATYSRTACIGCHRIRGNPASVGVLGPELTHFGSRLTLGAGLYPNDAPHLARWIKNARVMKPGVIMNTLGKGEYDPIAKLRIDQGGLTDEQIADIVAYLLSLK
jgi:cytochrome c oxidase subunit 2